jgi:hypothetical protein
LRQQCCSQKNNKITPNGISKYVDKYQEGEKIVVKRSFTTVEPESGIVLWLVPEFGFLILGQSLYILTNYEKDKLPLF